MVKDFNRGQVKSGETFHFQHSLISFIWIDRDDSVDGGYFVDIDEFRAYTLDELANDGFYFYSKEEDEDFKGVEVDGKLEWVN